ncbi:GMC family oxidoreductase [Nonomuraea sp. NPDC049129]
MGTICAEAAVRSPPRPVPSDEELREYVKLATGSFFQHVGTCAMGTDERAVVDLELRVRGIVGLRIADGSVMPSIVAATNLDLPRREGDL